MIPIPQFMSMRPKTEDLAEFILRQSSLFSYSNEQLLLYLVVIDLWVIFHKSSQSLISSGTIKPEFSSALLYTIFPIMTNGKPGNTMRMSSCFLSTPDFPQGQAGSITGKDNLAEYCQCPRGSQVGLQLCLLDMRNGQRHRRQNFRQRRLFWKQKKTKQGYYALNMWWELVVKLFGGEILKTMEEKK